MREGGVGLTIKHTVVKDMIKITLLMVGIILFFSTVVQVLNIRQMSERSARQIFVQVEQVLDENSKELEQVQREYAAQSLSLIHI